MNYKHGIGAYVNHKCRCDECKKAWGEYHKNLRAGKPTSQVAILKARIAELEDQLAIEAAK